MHFRRRSHAAAPLPLLVALVTWAPIAVGIVLGTLTRGAVAVLGAQDAAAAVASVLLAALGAVLSTLWFLGSTEAGDLSRAVRLSLLWVTLSVVFRAFWLGAVLGGGWDGVFADYRIAEGQPGLIVTALVALAPFLLRRFRRGRA